MEHSKAKSTFNIEKRIHGTYFLFQHINNELKTRENGGCLRGFPMHPQLLVAEQTLGTTFTGAKAGKVELLPFTSQIYYVGKYPSESLL